MKLIFHLIAHLLIILRWLFKSVAELTGLLTIEKSGVSSANNLGIDTKSSDKVLVYTGNNSGPRTDTLETPPWEKQVVHYGCLFSIF